MDTLENIASKKICGGANSANTGKLGCLSLFGTPENLIAIPRGFVIPKETVFNLDYITDKVKIGKFTPIIGASNFEDVGGDDNYNTNSSGEKRNNLQGLPEYKLWFEEGHEFYREISKLRSYKSYDYLIGDDEGNWMAAKNSNGDFKGFTGGHLTPEMRKNKAKGGDSEMKAILVQFLNRKEWDINYDTFHSENLDFATEDIPAVNGVNLTITEIPTTGATVLKVKAVLAQDNNTLVEGLVLADFKVTSAGVNNPVTAVNEATPGNYELTITAVVLAEEQIAYLNETGVDSNIILNEGILYRSNSVSETTIAP